LGTRETAEKMEESAGHGRVTCQNCFRNISRRTTFQL
jgi:hypothetical protein